MTKRNKKVSYSQYATWLGCPLKWKLRYVDKIKYHEASIHTIFGTAMHRVIQDWLEECVYGGKSEVYTRSVDLSSKLKTALAEEAAPVLKQIDKEGNVAFLFDKSELLMFYNHGVDILNFLQDKQKDVFPTGDVVLHSIEYEINEEVRPGISFTGFIDVVTHNTVEDTYHLYDLKTSTRGWSEYQKKDKGKTDQVLLYKKFFSETNFCPIENITVSYVILKRQLVESPYPNPRVSPFSPPNGKNSMNRAWKEFEKFLDACFDEDGEYISKQGAKPTEFGCEYCDYGKKEDCKFTYDTRQQALDWVNL